MKQETQRPLRYYAPAEFAARLGVSTRTVRRMYESGRLPCRRVGRLVRIPETAFDTVWDA